MEIHNPSTSSLDISSYVLYDDKGASDSKAYIFPASTVLAPSAYLLICCNQDDASTGALFKIGSEDVISVADASLNVVDTSGVIPTGGERGDVDAVRKFASRSPLLLPPPYPPSPFSLLGPHLRAGCQ